MKKKQVLFIQGGGDGAHKEDAELAERLGKELGPDYEIRYPLMPDEDSPGYQAWKRRISDEIAAVGDGAFLVGHSLGAVILLMSLVESRPSQRIAGLFLIATPFVGEGGWPGDDFVVPKDVAGKLPDKVPVHLYHGHDDEIVPFAHLGLYAKALPQAVVRRLAGRNHQLNGDLSEVARDIELLGNE